jgi:hypothetical protein
VTHFTGTADGGWKWPQLVLGEEFFAFCDVFSQVQRIFFIHFYTSVGNDTPAGCLPKTPGLTAGCLLKMGVFFNRKFAILESYIIPIRRLCKHSC